jgi:Tfp pilus assembly protein FimT
MTLVELMVVMSIAGLLGMLAIPSLKNFLPRVRINNNMMLLSNEVAVARVRAISQSTDYKIEFHPDTDRYTIYKYVGSWVSLGDTVVAGTDLFSATGFTTAQTLIVTGNGLTNVPLSTQAAVEFRSPDGSMRKQLLIEPTGRVLITKWDGGAFREE